MNINIDSADVMSDGTIIAGIGATVKKSTNGGANWTDIYTIPGSPTQTRRTFVDSRGYIYVSGYNCSSADGLYRSIDGGANFTKVLALDTQCCIWGMDEDAGGNLYAGEYSLNSAGAMQIWKSADGETWVQKFSKSDGAGYDEHHIHDLRVDPSNGWIYASSGDGTTDILLRSKDAGETWATIYDGVRLLALEFKDGYVYIGTDLSPITSNEIKRFQDAGGASVTPETAYTMPAGYQMYLFSSAKDKNGDVYFGAADGVNTYFGLFKFDGSVWSVPIRVTSTEEGFHWLSRHNQHGKIYAGFGSLRLGMAIVTL
jgi:hypothetical protein